MEAVALSDKTSDCGHSSRATCRLALSTLYVLQVSGPIVECLAIGELPSSTACQKIGVGWVLSLASNECVLVDLLVASFGRTLVIVLVGRTTNTAHANSLHT